MNLRDVVALCVGFLIACGGQNAAAPPAPPTTEGPARPVEATPSTNEALPALPDGVTRCQALTDRLCTDLGPTTETCDLVRARTDELAERQCEVMTEHYGEVLTELQTYEARNQPLPDDKRARMVEGAVATAGPSDARVTIVLFSDFQCPFCAGAAQATHELIERYGDKVHVVFRQFPLPFHRNAHAAAEASLIAAAAGKFWPMHDLLFANQQELARESLTAYARTIGLDVSKFDAALNSQTFAAAVDADLQLGIDLGVDATPTMFLNGERVPNASDESAIAARIDAVLSAVTE